MFQPRLYARRFRRTGGGSAGKGTCYPQLGRPSSTLGTFLSHHEGRRRKLILQSHHLTTGTWLAMHITHTITTKLNFFFLNLFRKLGKDHCLPVLRPSFPPVRSDCLGPNLWNRLFSIQAVPAQPLSSEKLSVSRRCAKAVSGAASFEVVLPSSGCFTLLSGL